MRRAPETWAQCRLCGREVPPGLLTLHHLKPKQKGGKAGDRVEMCKPCHKQVHAVFSNTELAQVYPTVEQLRAAPQLKKFLGWIGKQKPGRVFRTIRSAEHPRSRRR